MDGSSNRRSKRMPARLGFQREHRYSYPLQTPGNVTYNMSDPRSALESFRSERLHHRLAQTPEFGLPKGSRGRGI